MAISYESINLPADAFCSMFNTSYTDSQLKAILDDLPFPKDLGVSIAGGALVRHLTKEDVFKGDIDIWASLSSGFEQIKSNFKKHSSFQETKFAYSIEYKLGLRKTTLQLVKNPIAAMPNVIDCFDFHHCKFAIAHSKKPFVISTPEAIAALAARKVKCSNITDAAYSLGRALRYKKRGFDADHAIDVLGGMICRGETSKRFNFAKEADFAEVVASTIGKS